MPSCTIPANEAMYGFGIRLSFYVQWAAIIAADYVFTPSRSVRERAVTFLMEVAVLIALAKHSREGSITAAEAYICSLLVSTTLLFHVPSVFWRMLCCCKTECDLLLGSRWRSWATPARDFLTGMRACYIVGLCGYEFWFWSAGVETLTEARDDTRCQRLGFLFGQVRLASGAFAGFQIVMYALLLAGAVYTAATGMHERCGERERQRARRKWRRRMRRSHLDDNASIIHLMRAIFHLVVAITNVIAVELAIRWNHITGAYSVTTTAQIFPLLLSACLVVRVIWHQVKMTQNEQQSDTCSCGSTDDRRRRRSAWPEPGPVPVPWIQTV